MTKRKSPPPPTIPPGVTEEEIAFLGHRQQDLTTAMAGTAMAAVDSGDFGRVHLAAIAHYLTNVAPDRIPPGQMSPYVRAIIKMFAADNPPGQPTKEAIDLLTQLWTNGNGMKTPEAHRLVALVTGKRVGAVRQSRSRARRGQV